MFSDSLNQIAERHPLWTLVLVLRVPFIVTVGYVLMVGDWLVEDVAFEAVRYVVLDKPYQLYLIAPLLLLAGIGIRFCGETMIDLVAPSLRYVGGISGFIVWALPGLLAALIGISTGAQFVNVAFDKTNFGTPDGGFLGLHEPSAVTGVVYALVGAVTGALPAHWIARIGAGFSPIDRLLKMDTLTIAAAAALLAAAIAIFVPFADWTNPAPAQLVGTFGVIALWAFAAVMYFSPLAFLAHIARTPVLLLLAIAAMVFSALNLNDNHAFRTVEAPAGKMYFQQRLSLKDWLKARENIDLYRYANYPVFIVASEGGGLRAAYFTNRVLQALQTICPTFALHTIAISSVSGGSVGTAGFVAQTANQIVPNDLTEPCRVAERQPPISPQQPKQPFADQLQRVYGEDHLAPLLAATFFPDALQRLLPKPIPQFDRARAIECSFERSLAPLASSAAPCSAQSPRLGALFGATDSTIDPPHLFFITTSVTTGAQIPISTREIRYRGIGSPPPSLATTETEDNVQGLANGLTSRSQAINNPQDIPITTAAFLSARFPFVLPPARFPASERTMDAAKNERLLDGGLFEASASWFAEQVLRSLQHERKEYLEMARRIASTSSKAGESAQKQPPPDRFDEAMKRAQFFVIVIRSTPCQSIDPSFTESLRECPELLSHPQSSGLAELASPTRALLNARLARGNDALRSLLEFADASRDQIWVGDIRFINHESVHIPLSWSLSREARRLMDKAAARIFQTFWPAAGFRQPARNLRASNPGPLREMTDLTNTEAIETLAFALCNTTSPEEFLKSYGAPAGALTSIRNRAALAVELCRPKKAVRDPKPKLPEVDRCENCDPKSD